MKRKLKSMLAVALCAVGLSAFAKEPEAVQLWKDGPYFATCNVGADKPEDYGFYFWWGDTVGYTNNNAAVTAERKWLSVADGTSSIKFIETDPPATNTMKKTNEVLRQEGWIDDSDNLVVSDDPATNHDAARAHLGAPWRMMTKAELDSLVANCDVEWTDNWNKTGIKGKIVKGKGDYSANSIFLPAAGLGNRSSLALDGSDGYYWSSTPPSSNASNANNLHFTKDGFSATVDSRCLGRSVRAVRDTPPEPPVPTASGESEEFAFDVREEIALAEGAVTIAGVSYSDTAWGAAADQANVTLGCTNVGTHVTGELKPGLSGEGATEVDLPKKDGDYKLTHSTGDLTSFVKFTVSGYPLGSEGNPWEIGANAAADVIAFSNGTDTVFFDPVRGTVTKAGLETVTNAMGGASFAAKLIAADGSETNDLVMVLGASGTAYDTIADALAADEASYTLFETKGYFVSYEGGWGSNGKMNPDAFIPTVPTNLTANAYTIVGYDFTGWSKDGTTVAYTNRQEGVDFAQPGETLVLTALWEHVGVEPTGYNDLADKLAKVTRPVTFNLVRDIRIPAGGKIVVPAGKSVTFNGIGDFDVTAEHPALFCGYPVGTGLKPEDLDRFKTDKDVKAYYEDGKVVVRGRGETEEFPWLLGTAGHEDEVTAWAGDGMIFTKPTRGTASVAALQSVTNALSGTVPGLGELKVISANGSATNNVVMLLGSDGVPYDTLADVLAANPMPETVRLFEVKGYFVSYDGNGAAGTMATDTFIPTIPTNLTANAYSAVGYAFAGWTTNGSDKVAYADRAAGVDFAQPGETLALKAKWTDTGAAVATFDALTNALVAATNQAASLPVTVNLTDDITVPQGGVVKVYASPAVTFTGAGKFDVTGIVPKFGEPVTVGEGLAKGDLDRFDADGVSKPVFEDGKVVLHARGETETFPWVLDGAKGVTAWVDPALTNLAAVVIDNGMPTATNEIDLVALTNNLAVYGYEPAKTPLNALLKVEDGGETAYVMPVEWSGEQGNAYKTLADALAAGKTVVVPNFVTEEIPEEIVETGTGDDGETYTAVVENKPAEDVEEPVKATYAEGLLDLATSEKKNVTLVVETVEEACIPTEDAEKLAAANTNGVAGVVGYAADYVDLSLYFNEDQQSEIGETIAIHVPWTINPRQAYRISRIHEGVTEPLPVGAENAVDGEYVEILADGFIIHAKKYSLYAIGEITLQPRYTVVVGDGSKTLGEEDPSYIATNFTVNVQGLDLEPGDIAGYCVRAKGEAAGEYAINFICTRIPQGYEGEYEELPGTFTITDDMDILAQWAAADAEAGYPTNGYVSVRLGCDPAKGKVKGEKAYKLKCNKKTGLSSVKVSVNATPKKGYVFAGWYEDPGFSIPATFDKAKDYRNAAQSLTATGNVYLFARFVEKTTAADPIAHLRFLGAGYCGADASEFAEEETWYQGVALPTNACQIAFGSLSLPTVKVSGLPSGVKFDKATCRFTGAPTKASTEKKPFFTVKISVKNASGATDVLVKNIRVEPLPAWAVGNFDGYHMEEGATNGTFAATVGKTGKVSGKTVGGLAATTFSAKNFSEVFTLDGTNLIYAVDVTVSYKDPVTKKTVKATDTLYLMEDGGTKLGVIGGGDRDGCGSVGVQRAWDRKDLAYPAFDTKALKDPLPLDNGITLKFGAKGKVTVGGKVNGVKVSGSTYVMPFAWHSTMTTVNLFAQVPVYVAPKKTALPEGFCEVYDVKLTGGAGADDKFDTVSVAGADIVFTVDGSAGRFFRVIVTDP